MIIQIRGTSGSGKSTVMRQVMEKLAVEWNVKWEPIYREGRKQPLFYVDDSYHVTVLGHYESPCGGCDTIGSARQVAELIQQHILYRHTLCEGLLLSEDVKWSSQMRDLRVIFLTTPTEQCLTNIRTRRAAAGNEKELKTDNTVNRVATIERARLKLIEAGVFCRRAPASQAVQLILQWIKEDYVQLHGAQPF